MSSRYATSGPLLYASICTFLFRRGKGTSLKEEAQRREGLENLLFLVFKILDLPKILDLKVLFFLNSLYLLWVQPASVSFDQNKTEYWTNIGRFLVL